MTDTTKAFDEARAVINKAVSGGFRKRALSMVDELESLVLGAPDDAESTVEAYYEKVTGAAPFEHPGGRYLVRKARIVLICRDLLDGCEPKAKYMFGKDAVRSAAFSGTLDLYREWMESLGQSPMTVATRLQRADVLLRYVEAGGSTDIGSLSATSLAEFISWLDGRYTAVGKSNILYTLRGFFACPAIASRLSFDPFGLLMNLHTPKHHVIPSVYSAAEVGATLGAIDRGTDAGRTLFLVVMLAAVYGLRSMDIKELKVGDIDFANDTITIVQHKTGSPLTLPLVEQVKLPLLDYMMNTRRECGFDNVLIRHRGSPGPYSPRNHFGDALRGAMVKGGVVIGGRKAGLHSLRHSLATGMLAAGVPANEIADVLGHGSVDSTKPYIWSDAERLRIAALEVA